MNQLINLPIQVDSRDVGFFYKLLGVYHTSRDDFISGIEGFLQGNDERQDKSIKSSMAELHRNSHGISSDSSGEQVESFYAAVCSRCTCGNCFNRFASFRREPWIPRGDGVFTNCKLGRITITECPVKDIQVSGYIYVTEAEWNRQNKIIEGTTETSLSAVKRELQQTKIAGEQIKQARELKKIQIAEEKERAKELEAAKAAEERKEQDLRRAELSKRKMNIEQELSAIPKERRTEGVWDYVDEAVEADDYALQMYNNNKNGDMPSFIDVQNISPHDEEFYGKPKWLCDQVIKMIEGYRRDYFKRIDQDRQRYKGLSEELKNVQDELSKLGSVAKSGGTKKNQKSKPLHSKNKTSRRQARK